MQHYEYNINQTLKQLFIFRISNLVHTRAGTVTNSLQLNFKRQYKAKVRKEPTIQNNLLAQFWTFLTKVKTCGHPYY